MTDQAAWRRKRQDGPPARLRVLLIGPLPPGLGGTTISFLQLVEELRARDDVAVRVIDTSRRGREGRLAELGVVLRLLPSAPTRIHSADVVTFHASTPGVLLFGPILLSLCRFLRRPLVVRGFGGSFDTEYEEMSPLRRRALERAFRADRVLLQTRALLDYFGPRLPDARLAWFANSRPLPPEPEVDRPPGAVTRFVFAGHVKPTKGIGEIVEAAGRLAGVCTVDVFGPLLDGCTRADVEAAPNVRYRGVLEPGSVTERLREYDAVLLPTYHFGEGYPGIVLEAYAAGRPVIASRFRALPEIVSDGESGLLVEPRSAEDLARAMRRLCESPETARTLRGGARARAREFSSARWSEEFVRICREVDAEHRGRRRPADARSR